MAKIFTYGIILFLSYGLIYNDQETMQALLNSPMQAFKLTKTVILSICLWNGILNIINKSNLLTIISKVIYPIMYWIYGKTIKDQETYKLLSSNIISNMLGLGTLATLSGLKAIKNLKSKKDICMLVVINTAGFSIIPSTLMTLRSQRGSTNILAFYPYSLFIGLTITIIAIILVRIFIHE